MLFILYIVIPLSWTLYLCMSMDSHIFVFVYFVKCMHP